MKDQTEKTKLLVSEMKRKASEFKTLQQAYFREMLTWVFDAHSDLISVGFTGYTPEFNDGDECSFRCDTKYPIVNGYDTNRCEWEDGVDRDTTLVDELSEKIAPILSEIPTDLLGGIFGTRGFKATITRDKIEVEDYDCGY